MIWLFGTTLFASAFLLFLVQPMVGRMVLPLLGGVPSVWNGCMLFFQAMLLAGYAYAHVGLTRLCPGPQRMVHLAVLLLAFLFLPPMIAPGRMDVLAAGAAPVPWLLVTLALMIAVPFAVLSATAPTLLRWFSRTRHPAAQDPHFLYAASNLGSLAALAAYPALVEPNLTLSMQAWMWSGGVGVVTLLVAACAWVGSREQGVEALAPAEPAPGAAVEGGQAPRVPAKVPAAGWWILLAAVPTSLVLGVTQYITTDLASVPLFWVVPLGVYLLTFVLAFAQRPWFSERVLARATPTVTAVGAFLVLSRASEPVWLILGLHLVVLFTGALLCHTRLALARPGPGDITRYYLCISIGGVLGGMFNSLLAPWIFRSVAEYPIALVAVCLLRPWPKEPWSFRFALDVALAVLIGGGAVTSMLLARSSELVTPLQNALGLGLPLVAVFACAARPLRFALGLALLLALGWDFARPQGRLLRADRTFFGVSRVTTGLGGRMRFLVHGNTLHGRQWLDPTRQGEPLAYYHRTGPAADLFDWLDASRPKGSVAVVGLGAGAMAAYARPGQHWVFYEIDPAVIRIAQDTNCFTFLAHCRADQWRIDEGDARLQLGRAPDAAYDLLAIDAFSSDAIPLHLLTREAVQLYLRKLRPGGLLAFHISNRYVELAPVLADLAADAGLVCRDWDDWDLRKGESDAGKERSRWVVLARSTEDLGVLRGRVRWLETKARAGTRVWTDDYANLLGAFRWR